ncbi:MAG: hypothetical protein ABI334_07585 [Candidatus Dormiibacterota bacterium]
MITSIVTFLTTRLVYVFITTVVVVAAVPTLIVAIHGDTITITSAASASRQHGDDERARIILLVKTAGDNVIVKLNGEEAGCDSQIAQLASSSTLSATATSAELEKGKSDFHNAELQFVNEIKADEDELDKVKVITTETQQTFLVRISKVQVTALGEDGHSGTLITVCQTILVEIRQVIIVVHPPPPPPSGGEGDDGDIRLQA